MSSSASRRICAAFFTWTTILEWNCCMQHNGYSKHHTDNVNEISLMEPLVSFLNFVFVSNFSILASHLGELTLFVGLGFNLSPGLKCMIFFLFVLQSKWMRALEILSTGLQKAPDWDSFHLQNIPAKTFPWAP
jgi:hypothetical protein